MSEVVKKHAVDVDDNSEDYKNLISLLLGSHHAHIMKKAKDVFPQTVKFSCEGEVAKKCSVHFKSEKTVERLGKI